MSAPTEEHASPWQLPLSTTTEDYAPPEQLPVSAPTENQTPPKQLLSPVPSLTVDHAQKLPSPVSAPTEALYIAAWQGKEVVLILPDDFHCDLTTTGMVGQSLLRSACEGGNVSLVRTLIQDYKADIDVRDDNNNSPLHRAASHGKEEIVLVLLNEFHCDPSTKGFVGRSLLHSACAGGNVSLVRTLIHDYKADINGRDDQNNTPLHIAACHGKEKVVLVLLDEFNCDPGTKGLVGRSLLHFSCAGGNVSLVRTVIHDYQADIDGRDDENSTPLHIAARHGKEKVVLVLLDEFNCDPGTKGLVGRSLLHFSCAGGNVSLVRTVIHDYQADIDGRDDENSTPLHIAARHGKEKVVLVLLNEFNCDPSTKGFVGQSLLHSACDGGNVSLVRTLIHDYKADIDGRDDENNTPLHTVARHGKEKVALVLLNEFNCDPSTKGSVGRSLLHSACAGGNVSLVRTLIHDYKADINGRDDQNNTPLHIAACHGKEKVVLVLLDEFNCDPGTKGLVGMSLLHFSCAGGNVSLVRTVIHDYQADIDGRDDENNTPLHIAACHGKEKVVLVLLNEFNCDPSTKGFVGRSLLHSACAGGNVSLVRTLIHDYKADINGRDDQNNTPLHIAACHGKEKVVLVLLDEFNCDPGTKGFVGCSLLHFSCAGGNVSLVRTLIHDYQADIDGRDDENNTPLHTAAGHGKEKVVLVLLNEFHCDPNTRGFEGKSPLHFACKGGSVNLVRTLVLAFNADITSQDQNGNTCLHISASNNRQEVALLLLDELASDRYITASCFSGTSSGSHSTETAFSQHWECLKALFPSAALMLKNTNNQTPREVAEVNVISVLDERMKCLLETKICSDCTDLYVYGKDKFSGSKCATRVFVLGNSGVGKSSLVEAIQRGSFFQSFWKVRQSSIPPHTAGIVPHFYRGRDNQGTLLYDFAGDAEYYSSHSAILENLASSRKGNNLFIIVVDLQQEMEVIKIDLFYWVSFIHHHRFKKESLSLVVVGSHADKVESAMRHTKGKKINEICGLAKHRYRSKIIYTALDCRDPGSEKMGSLRLQLHNQILSSSVPVNLSVLATLLLGILQRDFKNTIACPVKEIQTHIEQNVIPVPSKVDVLHPCLQELHEAGIFLMLKSKDMHKSHVILDSTKLTNGVHQMLFSVNTELKQEDAFFHIGIVPEDYFSHSGYISKDCLIQLQYCQEISHEDVGVFPYNTVPDSSDKSVLFFPALVSLDKSAVSWTTPPDLTYGIGWLAWCCNLWHFFSPRFLHVLILRLICRFALSSPLSDHESGSPDPSPYFQQFCGVWKTGVCFLTKERIECTVELVSNKELVVRVRGEENKVENCNNVFSQIISYVMNAKAEFCHFIKPEFYLLDSTSEADYLCDDNLFSMLDVVSALTSEKKGDVVSVNRRKRLRWNRIASLRHFTHWKKLFPIDYESVLPYLVDITKDSELISFGLQLDMLNIAKMLEADFPTDIRRRKHELMREWMSSSHDPPCWWTLEKALRHPDVQCTRKAEEIRDKYGKLACNVSPSVVVIDLTTYNAYSQSLVKI